VPADRYITAPDGPALALLRIGDDGCRSQSSGDGDPKKAAALANRDLGQLPSNLAT